MSTAFYTLSWLQKLAWLQQQGYLNPQDAAMLAQKESLLPFCRGEKMIENVVGIFGLPLGIALHTVVNGQAYAIPMVVEEPSIVAALSAASKRVKQSGGFHAEMNDSLICGQIVVLDAAAHTADLLAAERQALLQQAQQVHPNLLARGGGIRDITWRSLSQPTQAWVVELHIDTCDAMGANLVNTVCERLAPAVAKLCGGRVLMQILSNYVTQSVVTVRGEVALAQLQTSTRNGAQVRDDMVAANVVAQRDVYRAVTHNKGIMNAVDAIAIATGNDWRAIEAAVGAYAARSGHYQPLTTWTVGSGGQLCGSMQIPLKVGTVGGNLQANPGVALCQRLLKVTSAQQLAMVMAAAGLAQNLAALRALVTDGIQQGHMRLHARSVAAAAKVPQALQAQVIEELVASQDIKLWHAQQISQRLQQPSPAFASGCAGSGKVVLLGEHAVVYGCHALAVPLSQTIVTSVLPTQTPRVRLTITPWGVDGYLHEDLPSPLSDSIALVLRRLGVEAKYLHVVSHAQVPRAMGLGASAALAVSVVRAMLRYAQLNWQEDQINALAFDLEKLAHGRPSGIDNTMATLAMPLLYRRDPNPVIKRLSLAMPLHLVIGLSTQESLTAPMIALVQQRLHACLSIKEHLLRTFDGMALAGAQALADCNLQQLAELMNLNHGLLAGLGVSTLELEKMVALARHAGALAAKMTGGGGGGSMVALCADRQTQANVEAALQQAGYHTLHTLVQDAKPWAAKAMG